jgi:UDP-2,3-diacylglucosamine pyrophosphatase LpxH
MLAMITTAFQSISSAFSVFKTISSALSSTTGMEATTLGATGISGVTMMVAIYYGRSMYQDLMHRLDRLEDQIKYDINDRHDDLNTKLDAYHETDVRTYERMLVTSAIQIPMTTPRLRSIESIESDSDSEDTKYDSDSESHETQESQLLEKTAEDVKKIKGDVRYIKGKVRKLDSRHKSKRKSRHHGLFHKSDSKDETD